jgi:protoheme ferro-lyase|tara:strand:+ start:300 stop:455 length:156 start_codon:yes stop_codon:yes gene_type:complete
MDQSFGGLPNKEISSVVSTWWRERVKELINEERAEDARSLYLEFGEVSPMV